MSQSNMILIPIVKITCLVFYTAFEVSVANLFDGIKTRIICEFQCNCLESRPGNLLFHFFFLFFFFCLTRHHLTWCWACFVVFFILWIFLSLAGYICLMNLYGFWKRINGLFNLNSLKSFSIAEGVEFIPFYFF
jgi:hypothetical protein